ncbi:hypothetical protein PT7_0592 [Pusillimonas sp. T7-7]|uniref:DUF1902 domain-containing protein n=1 Tax=Pollutimonas bauzanensis TaxID=658167 RepID=A0A1M5XLP3_9BURK|nr:MULTISPECIES: DUF1902 domain-containing protein [Alcaligenaceae]AEC19132.1 hypothetical protein PT7_0592 [Pusillimonas sp. T7-7]SHI00750.1 protein of unknown function [Pollutimonas bauzanensis]
MQKILFIQAEWDQNAEVWVAASNDVPGLVTEAKTLEILSTKLNRMIPELLDANGVTRDAEVPFELLARRFFVTRSPDLAGTLNRQCRSLRGDKAEADAIGFGKAAASLIESWE